MPKTRPSPKKATRRVALFLSGCRTCQAVPMAERRKHVEEFAKDNALTIVQTFVDEWGKVNDPRPLCDHLWTLLEEEDAECELELLTDQHTVSNDARLMEIAILQLRHLTVVLEPREFHDMAFDTALVLHRVTNQAVATHARPWYGEASDAE